MTDVERSSAMTMEATTTTRIDVAGNADLAQKLCWVCISSQPSSSSTGSSEQQTKQYFWPCLLFPNMDSYYEYYCCSGLNDAKNSAATKKETLKLASKVLEKMADEFMVPAFGQNEDEEEVWAGGLTSPTSLQTPVRIAKMLGRGLDDYLEIALDDIQECVTDFTSHLMQNIEAQAKPIAFFGSDHDLEDEESAALYLDFMKSVDEAQYILKTGIHPTAEEALTGPFYRKAEQTLKWFHDMKKKNSNEEQSKPAARQSRRGASRSDTSNGTVAAPAAAESLVKAVNDRYDPMDTEAVDAEGKTVTKSDQSAVRNMNPGIEITDTFDAAVRKLKLAGWDEMMVKTQFRARSKRVYVRPGTSDQFDKKDLKKYLRETYGWVENQKDNSPVKRKGGRPRKDAETQSASVDETKKTKKLRTRGASNTTSAPKKTKKKTASGSTMTPKKVTVTKKKNETKHAVKRKAGRPRKHAGSQSNSAQTASGYTMTPKKVTVTKKKNATKHDMRLSPRRIELATPIMERKKKDGDDKKKNGEQVGRRSGRARVPPGIVIESAGGRTPSGSDYVKQSFERRQNELKKFRSDEEADFYNFNYLMKKLVRSLGWKYGRNPLGGWIYYKPEGRNIKCGGEHMADYFITEMEVIEFCRERNYYSRRAELGLGSSSSSTASNKKKTPNCCTP